MRRRSRPLPDPVLSCLKLHLRTSCSSENVSRPAGSITVTEKRPVASHWTTVGGQGPVPTVPYAIRVNKTVDSYRAKS